MKSNQMTQKTRNNIKNFTERYDKDLQCIVLEPQNIDGIYPFLLKDPEVGTYKILKTRNGRLQMVK